MATNTQRIAELEQRIADLETNVAEFRMSTILEVAGIAFSEGRASAEKYAAAVPGSQRRPRHLSVVDGSEAGGNAS